jgi:hypothetical protein
MVPCILRSLPDSRYDHKHDHRIGHRCPGLPSPSAGNIQCNTYRLAHRYGRIRDIACQLPARATPWRRAQPRRRQAVRGGSWRSKTTSRRRRNVVRPPYVPPAGCLRRGRESLHRGTFFFFRESSSQQYHERATMQTGSSKSADSTCYEIRFSRPGLAGNGDPTHDTGPPRSLVDEGGPSLGIRWVRG